MTNSQKAYHHMVATGQIKSWKEKIMFYFKHHKTGTIDTIATWLCCQDKSIWRRLSELGHEGKIIKTAKDKVSNESGRDQSIWKRVKKCS